MGSEVETTHDESQKQQVEDYAPEEVQKEVDRLEDPEWITAQKRYLRKLDLIILPTVSALYFFEYLDRGNVAVRFMNCREKTCC